MPGSEGYSQGGVTDRGAFAKMPRPPVSVVILTYNEASNIASCIESCCWCDDVHVLDSGSTDGTQEIARSLGATVHYNKFRSFGDQRNWAIDNIPCRHPWHFHLDADERFVPELVREMHEKLGPGGGSTAADAYLCPSKMILMGRWLKHSAGYPSYQMRLFRCGKCRFVDFGHGQREDCRGPIGTIQTPYLHFNFSKGVLDWFHKHNDYSTREAEAALQVRETWRPTVGQLFTGDSIARRRHWKNLSYFVKGRALWRFLYTFVVRGGMLDGIAGLRYCSMISSYEYWTELKIRERTRPWAEATRRKVERMLEEAPRTR